MRSILFPLFCCLILTSSYCQNLTIEAQKAIQTIVIDSQVKNIKAILDQVKQFNIQQPQNTGTVQPLLNESQINILPMSTQLRDQVLKQAGLTNEELLFNYLSTMVDLENELKAIASEIKNCNWTCVNECGLTKEGLIARSQCLDTCHCQSSQNHTLETKTSITNNNESKLNVTQITSQSIEQIGQSVVPDVNHTIIQEKAIVSLATIPQQDLNVSSFKSAAQKSVNTLTNLKNQFLKEFDALLSNTQTSLGCDFKCVNQCTAVMHTLQEKASCLDLCLCFGNQINQNTKNESTQIDALIKFRGSNFLNGTDQTVSLYGQIDVTPGISYQTIAFGIFAMIGIAFFIKRRIDIKNDKEDPYFEFKEKLLP